MKWWGISIGRIRRIARKSIGIEWSGSGELRGYGQKLRSYGQKLSLSFWGLNIPNLQFRRWASCRSVTILLFM